MNNYKQRFREKFEQTIKVFPDGSKIVDGVNPEMLDFISQELNLLLDRVEKEVEKKKVKWIKGDNIYEVENGVNINIINNTMDELRQKLEEIRKEL